MKSKIGMVLAGVYLLAFVVTLCIVFIPQGDYSLLLLAFYLPWTGLIQLVISNILLLPFDIIEFGSMGLNILINALTLYLIGLGITKFRARNKIQI